MTVTTLQKLLLTTQKALKLIVQFLAILILGMLAALLYAIPWLIRMAAILVWLAGMAVAIEAVDILYRSHSPAGAVMALQFVIIFLMVAWVGVVIQLQPLHIWGALVISGATMFVTVLAGIPWLQNNWQHTDLFFRVLPPALFTSLMLYTTIRLRLLREAKHLPPARPAFSWLPQLYSKLRGNHERNNSQQ